MKEWVEMKENDEISVPSFVCFNSSRSFVETVFDSTSFCCFSTDDFNVST
jgi:hypothetical protein